MKNFCLLTLVAAAAIFSPLALADDPGALRGCDAKKHELRVQIDEAAAHHDDHRLTGLKSAFDQVNANCTEASLRMERENKIKAAQQKVIERQSDLDAAVVKGDSDKISKRAAKLAKSQRELQSAQEQLNK